MTYQRLVMRGLIEVILQIREPTIKYPSEGTIGPPFFKIPNSMQKDVRIYNAWEG